MKFMYTILYVLVFIPLSVFSQSPVSHPVAPWAINEKFTDEFNAGQIDGVKWDQNPNDWGTWSWEPENAYMIDTALTLRMVQRTHMRNGKEYYFTSGIVRHKQTLTYGYFEARIKGSEKGQGTCPAFWIYSRGEPTPTEEGGVKYCEIDAVEIFQIPYDFKRLEMNLHARILQDGELTWIRPGQGHAELTHNTWLAPWDPRDDYHTYGVWSRVDSIFWFVDGIQRGAKKNHYWHLPMYPTVSMGLRTPYEKYINGVRTVVPYPDSIQEPGFPTEMNCDYVRVWNTDAQLYADHETYYNAEFSINNGIEFECRYFAGNDQTILAESWNGLTCNFQELRADGSVANEITLVDESVIGEESGESVFQFNLNGLTPSASLPDGHQYVIRPVFKTSMEGGMDVFLKEGYYPISLVLSSSVNDQEAKDKIHIVNQQNSILIERSDELLETEILVHDLAGRELYRVAARSKQTRIDHSFFPVDGIYLVTVKAGKLHRVEKVSLMNR